MGVVSIWGVLLLSWIKMCEIWDISNAMNLSLFLSLSLSQDLDWTSFAIYTLISGRRRGQRSLLMRVVCSQD